MLQYISIQSDEGYDDAIPLAGLKRPSFSIRLLASTADEAGPQWLWRRLIGNDTGLGKSLVYLAYVVAERQLYILTDEGRKSRATQDGKHLMLGQDDTCTSDNQRSVWL